MKNNIQFDPADIRKHGRRKTAAHAFVFKLCFRLTDNLIYKIDNLTDCPELMRGFIGNDDSELIFDCDKKFSEVEIIRSKIVNDIGIQLVNISIQDSEPPTVEVMDAFKAVETAKQGKETSLNNANKYRNEKLPQADAQVDKILQEAESTKTQRINEAEAEVARFDKMYEEYIKYPLLTKQRMFYETMEDVLPSLKVIINSDDSGVQKLLPLEPLMEGGTN
jgi:membrane protease subunit HflK